MFLCTYVIQFLLTMYVLMCENCVNNAPWCHLPFRKKRRGERRPFICNCDIFTFPVAYANFFFWLSSPVPSLIVISCLYIPFVSFGSLSFLVLMFVAMLLQFAYSFPLLAFIPLFSSCLFNKTLQLYLCLQLQLQTMTHQKSVYSLFPYTLTQ